MWKIGRNHGWSNGPPMVALWVVRSILGGPLKIRVNLAITYGFQDVFFCGLHSVVLEIDFKQNKSIMENFGDKKSWSPNGPPWWTSRSPGWFIGRLGRPVILHTGFNKNDHGIYRHCTKWSCGYYNAANTVARSLNATYKSPGRPIMSPWMVWWTTSKFACDTFSLCMHWWVVKYLTQNRWRRAFSIVSIDSESHFVCQRQQDWKKMSLRIHIVSFTSKLSH